MTLLHYLRLEPQIMERIMAKSGPTAWRTRCEFASYASRQREKRVIAWAVEASYVVRMKVAARASTF